MKTCIIVLLIFLFISIQGHSCFFVKIVNVTTCKGSDYEEGELDVSITNKDRFDQEISGKVKIPFDLDDDAILQYKASFLNADNDWEVLYKADRYLCSSLVTSLNYQMLADETSFPHDCPISEGTYEFEDYPISGQYVVFGTVRGAGPLVKHRLRLRQDEQIILCRVIYTMSYEK